MSRAGETGRPDHRIGSDSGAPGRLDPVADRFKTVLALEENKPDFPDLGSPVSPLRQHASTQTSSCSSSSGSAGKAVPTAAIVARKPGAGAPDAGRLCHSGELFVEFSPTAAEGRDLKTATHRRSGSGPLIFSGGSGGGGSSSTASSPVTNALPTGNICPSGKIGKTGMMHRTSPRSDVLGSGTGNYGHGSIIRGGMGGGGGVASRPGGVVGIWNSGGSNARMATGRMDPLEATRAGNEHYKKGQYGEALAFYDKAVAMCPENAACRGNRAAALMGLGRLEEAARECEEAVRLDPTNGRAHQRLACLKLRLGLVEDARKHHFLAGQPPDPVELQKLQSVERHWLKCGDARKVGDWKSALREADAAIAAGADSSLLLVASRAEALFHLHQLDEADSILTRSLKFEDSFSFFSAAKIFGMLSHSYFYIVKAQVDMALGRFENAVMAAEKAKQMDGRNIGVTTVLNNIRSVARARAQGNELFKSGNFAEACTAYGEGLKYDPSNPVLLCNRAACRSKLGQWVKSVEDCNEALRIQPNYTKALLRRADSYAKLERWSESVRDYEVLRKELPGDNEVAEALFHAQIALKTSRGEEISNLKFGGEVEEVTSAEQFRAAVSLPGASVVYFMTASNLQCIQITPFVDALCTRYPSANFLKVDVKRSPGIAVAENVRVVPTFKIYKNGKRVKEMICPSQQVLEYSVRHYSL
ncbi:TPR repeat-containing thioredoxin TTL1-like [Musa acuminata AAA Group]|uniref:TPR repeat-containing thioredoxin TTL1-like n=1 Tax=Musa acuminata AAA Group TaxID=214697 RepID=UPI0031D69595